MDLSTKNVTWVLLVVAGYLSFNTSINLFNRWCLGVHGFSFPLTITFCHFTFAALVLTPFMLLIPSYREKHAENWNRDWKGYLITGIATAINVGFNNSSLVYISLSMNQVITATMPVLTCMCAMAIEKHYRPNSWQVYGILPICAGVMLAVYEEAHNETVGIILVSVATLANAVRTALSSFILSGKLDCLVMTWYCAPISALAMIPFAIYRERTQLGEYFERASGETYMILLGGSTLALCYNYILFLTIQTLSGVTMNVMGNVKIILLLFLSRVFLGELAEIDVQLAAGVALTFGGFFLYRQALYYGTYVKSLPPPVSPAGPKTEV
eukprot:gene8185-9718_t